MQRTQALRRRKQTGSCDPPLLGPSIINTGRWLSIPKAVNGPWSRWRRWLKCASSRYGGRNGHRNPGGTDPSALRAHHALDQCARDPDHDRLGMADLQCLATVPVLVSAEHYAWWMACRRYPVASRRTVAAAHE